MVKDLDSPERGLKYDAGKTPVVQGLFRYFARALMAVANVSGYGYQKYKAWGGWRKVPDGLARYSNAKGRHALAEGVDGLYDPESHMLHKAHEAWNVLAELELMLEQGQPLYDPSAHPAAAPQSATQAKPGQVIPFGRNPTSLVREQLDPVSDTWDLTGVIPRH